MFSAQIWKFAEQTQLQGFFETVAATPALVTLGLIPSARLWMISSLSSPRAKGMIWLHPDQNMVSKV
jgi:hypothetical protein